MQTIPEVLARLEAIIEDCTSRDCRTGYFAVLYHRTTKRVGEWVLANRFDDGPRMERLDVIFANRYIEAYEAWRRGQTYTACWRVAFEAAANGSPLILQHLLLGMNAHINLDLGIAAADTMQDEPLEAVHQDFMKINDVLASLVADNQAALTRANPLLKLLRLHRHRYDEMLVNFSMAAARDGAWAFARTVAGKAGAAREECIAARDAAIAHIGSSVAAPRGFWLRRTVGLIRLFEKKKTSEVIKILGA